MGTIEQLPAIYASHSAIYAIASGQAESRYITKGQGITMVSDTPVIMLNAPLLASRLGYPQCSGLDILELFAFVHPAHFIVPTVQGLAKFLNITLPMKNDIADDSKMPEFLRQSAQKLLETMRDPHWPERFGAWRILEVMERRRWPWAAFVSPYLDKPQKPESSLFSRLPEWEEQSPRPQPYQGSLNDEDVLDRLAHMTGAYAEKRQGQRDYASQAAAIFSRARQKTGRISCWQRRERGSVKPWVISRPLRFGQSKIRGQSGYPPIQKHCNANWHRKAPASGRKTAPAMMRSRKKW